MHDPHLFSASDKPEGGLAGRSAGRPARRAVIAGALALPIAGFLSACAPEQSSLSQQANEGNNKNYIAGDGSVEVYDADQRTDPVDLTAETYDGESVSTTDWRGNVGILNFWYAACAPCRVEAPHLRELHDEFKADGVTWLGINGRDEKATAEAFERTFEVPYSSVPDSNGRVLLQLTKYVPAQAYPTTLVLDKQGRVAARILGLADKSTLKALIETALAEKA
ncbi:TlpA family protein disulfide reductase [Neomicrococcus aestuarii]|uniref:TlpA family protein disulfide reductase n=1 Tax=Neomicrococcus aestuarii TaxID=556325 RepID=UPI000A036CCE|nr:TlpA disulfide reductase family protein [Neomicrococcus aestuarii]